MSIGNNKDEICKLLEINTLINGVIRDMVEKVEDEQPISDIFENVNRKKRKLTPNTKIVKPVKQIKNIQMKVDKINKVDKIESKYDYDEIGEEERDGGDCGNGRDEENEVVIVKSMTSDKTYEINLTKNTCSCPDFVYRTQKNPKHVCKHLKEFFKNIK